MKNLLLGVLVICVLTSHSLVEADEVDLPCRDIGKLAELIMYHRQEGKPFRHFIEMTDKYELDDADRKLIVTISIAAYNKPKMKTDEYRNEIITEFSNVWEVGCHQAKRDR